MTGSDASNPEIGTTLDAGGTATNVHDVAPTHGRPVAGTVLLLHGSGPGATAWGTWRPTIPALASGLRVVAPDIPGFGDTQRPADGVYTPSHWVEHLVALLDALGLDRVSVVGNSFGGALALRLATEHPDRVDRLALMGSAGLSLPVTPSLGKVWGYRPSFDAMRGLVDLLAHDTSLVTDDLVRLRFEASTLPGRQEAYEQMFPHPHQEVLDRLAVPEERIATLPHETLVIHGREDSVIPLSSAVRLLELIGRAELHVFGQCGHWTQFEHPERFNTLLSAFLNR
ncbi:alpha/beta fold hydrolase [Amycolatopsis sp. NPDC101161]|uniref:alpha/beta fold hydrolase n=1 Tax=Amycolatopsis sp. NPDC101161 TaxID=3363940 RepID=UPI003809C59F